MSRISDILSKQVAVAETLLQRAIAIPDGDSNTRVAGYIRYDESITRPLAKDVEAWQTETTEFLRVLYGEEARQVADFERCINNKNHYFKFREGIQSELQDCISKLNAFIKADTMIQETMIMDSKKPTGINKSPMVFISHSSKDKDFAEALVVLLEDLGMDSTNVFCSSVDGYGVGLSQDIFETLRELFNEHNLFVIFIHSPRYYKSYVSLNEMGAAWVLKTDFCSFLTTDMDFSMMKGVVNGSTISIKVDNDDTPARLSELKDKLTNVFGLSTIDGTKWERKRQAFLDKVLSITFEASSVDAAEQTVIFSPEELQIFSKWANNTIDKTYTVVKNRAGLEVHFGYQNGYTFPYGEGEAKFDDFMQRLKTAGFIVAEHYDNKYRQPVYKITKQGYDYAKTLIS